MSEMVERVARALFNLQKGPHAKRASHVVNVGIGDYETLLDWDGLCSAIDRNELPPIIRDNLFEEARAALAAAREPTYEMTSKCHDVRPDSDGDGGSWLDTYHARSLWQAMIDEALR